MQQQTLPGDTIRELPVGTKEDVKFMWRVGTSDQAAEGLQDWEGQIPHPYRSEIGGLSSTPTQDYWSENDVVYYWWQWVQNNGGPSDQEAQAHAKRQICEWKRRRDNPPAEFDPSKVNADPITWGDVGRGALAIVFAGVPGIYDGIGPVGPVVP